MIESKITTLTKRSVKTEAYDVSTVKDLAMSGKSVKEIANKLNMSRACVSTILSSIYKTPPKNDLELAVLQLVRSGLSHREVAKRLKKSRGFVRYVLRVRRQP